MRNTIFSIDDLGLYLGIVNEEAKNKRFPIVFGFSDQSGAERVRTRFINENFKVNNIRETNYKDKIINDYHKYVLEVIGKNA